MRGIRATVGGTATLDEAVAKAKGCPVFLGGAKFVVLETFNVM